MYRRVTNEKMQKKTHKQRTSCGGMSKDTVLRSTFTKLSVQGRTKKSPGKMQRPCFYFLYPVNRCFSNLDHPILEKLLFFLCINYFLMFVFTLIKFNINFPPPQYMLFWRNWTQCTMHQLSKKWFRNTFNPFIHRKPAGKSNIFQLNNTLEMLLSRF